MLKLYTIFDTNVLRYLWINANVDKDSIRKFRTNLFFYIEKNSSSLAVSSITDIEILFSLTTTRESKINSKDNINKKIKLLKSKYAHFSIDTQVICILKAIYYRLDPSLREKEINFKEKLSKRKINIFDWLIIASAINEVYELGFLGKLYLSFITADISDFNKTDLERIFNTVEYKNIGYIIQNTSEHGILKKQLINIYAIEVKGLQKDFLQLVKICFSESI